MPIPHLTTAQRNTLVTLLCACQSVADSSTRDAIVAQLPDALRHGIARHAATRVDVTNIVQRCLAYTDGLDALVAAVHVFEGDSLPMQDLLRWLRAERHVMYPDDQAAPDGKTDVDPSLLPSLSGTPLAVSGAIMAGTVTEQGIAADQRGMQTDQTQGEVHPPFIAGPPITHPRMFFGRERIVSRILALFRHPPLQNAAIIGPRRSGKTSLLYYLQTITRTPADQVRPGQRTDWLTRPERYRWVLVDFQDARMRTKAGLLRYLLSSLEFPVPDPCTLEDFLEVMSTSVHTPTVILLDELGKALQHYPDLDDNLWESLRSLGPQVGGNLGFVLATHVSPVQLAHDSGHSSPFFNIFGYTTQLGPFSDAEARALIASSPLPFPEDDVDWILAQSGRWPILLQVLCRERLAAFEAGETDDAWRDEAIQQMEPFLPYTITPAAPAPVSAPEPVDRARLRQVLTSQFNDSELRDLCFDLGVDYESLPGAGKGDKARELIAYCERHGLMDTLVVMCRAVRPDALM